MGGSKKRAGSASKAPKVEVDPEVAAKSRETKGEGDKLFVKKEWAKAIEAYASAAALLPEGAAERADILCAKAACLYAQRRWRDSARECSAALAAAPSAAASPAGAKALLRRAHCYEHLALYKQALSDAQAYNRTELASEDSKRLEQRLRVALQGGNAANGSGAAASASAAAAAARGPSLAVNRGAASGGAAGRAAAAAAAYQQAQAQAQAAAQQQRPPINYVAAKITLAGGEDGAAAAAPSSDTRAVLMPANVASYAMLRAGAIEKFGPQLAPGGKPVPFVLRYTDGAPGGGAPVTITSRHDVGQAAAAALLRNPAAARQAAGVGYVLPFEVTAVRVADAEQVPPVPEEEEQQRQLHEQYTRVSMAKMQKAQQEAKAGLDAEEARQRQEEAEAAEAAGAAGAVGQVDEWLLEFAEVFRDMSQIDADAHLDATNEGWDLMQRAMQAALRSDAALPLFAKAQDKFAEVTATGLINWGNVHINVAHKYIDDAAPAAAEAARAPGVADTNEARAKAAQKAALAAAAKKAGAELDQAERRYQDALKYRPDFFDALAAMGTVEFERAKLRAGLAVVPTDGIQAKQEGEGEGGEAASKGVEGAAEAAEAAEAAAAANCGEEEGKTGGAAEVTPAAAEALREALRRVSPGDVSAAKKHYDAAAKWFEKARAAAAALDAKRVADAQEAARAREGASEGGAAAAAAEEAGAQQLSPEMSSESQALIMSGNVAYEWSQVLSAVAGDEPAKAGGGGKASDAAGKAWRAALDDATARFREAKCSEADVRAALKNHTRAADLDIGPDPVEEEEEEAEAPEAAAAEAAAAAPAADAAAAPKERPAPKGLPSLDLKSKKKAAAAADFPKA